MALVDIAVVEFVQTYGAEEIRNVFTYERVNTAASWESLASSFIETVVDAINLLQVGDIVNRLVRITSLGDLSVQVEEVPPGGGDGTGEQMLPLHDAVNFTLRTDTRAVRPGKKRVSGILEASQSGGVITSPTTIANLELVRTALGKSLPASATTPDFRPVVVRRVKYAPRPGAEAYRLPLPGDPLVVAGVRQVLVNTKITTQRSRGNGR